MNVARIAYHCGRRLCLSLFLLIPALAPALTPNEALLVDHVRKIAAAPVGDFTVLGETDTGRDGGYRYQLAFLGYGLCSAIAGEPALRTEGHSLFVRLLEKMEHPTTMAYWKAFGYAGDGVTRNNVMYRGHLNLMYALVHDRFGETRFDERFHALSRALFEETTADRPICCEPDQLFIQCNSVTILSLWLHDRAFGTSYASAGNRVLAWAREHMCLAGTTLVRDDYRPSTGKSSAARTGCANAWTIAFLAGVPELQTTARAMYTDWRRTFVEPASLSGAGKGTPEDKSRWLQEVISTSFLASSFGMAGVVKGTPAGEALPPNELLVSGLLATTFGLLAARAEGDEVLHHRLEVTVKAVEHLVNVIEPWLSPERKFQARTYQTIALFARTFRGWDVVLGSDHGAERKQAPRI